MLAFIKEEIRFNKNGKKINSSKNVSGDDTEVQMIASIIMIMCKLCIGLWHSNTNAYKHIWTGWDRQTTLS